MNPTKQESLGYNSCGQQWGWGGEHQHFSSDYVCDCGHVLSVDQCAAWPIRVMDCPKCLSGLELALVALNGCLLR